MESYKDIMLHLRYILTDNIIFKDIENITQWREDMNFMFEWQEQKIHIFELTCNILFII